MAEAAPIQPDARVLPRVAPKGLKPNLIGMTREAMRQALIEAGAPEKQARMRVG